MARPCLDRNPKFKRLVRTLGQPKPHVRGYLEMLWDSANECGDSVIGDSDAVEAVAEWPGDPGELTKALLESGGGRPGFIELEPGQPGVYRIHDYWDHAPDYVKKRRARELERRSKGSKLESESTSKPAEESKPIATKSLQENNLTAIVTPNPIASALETPADAGGQRRTTADADCRKDENGLPHAPAPAPAHNDTTSPLPPPARVIRPAADLAADPAWVVVVEFLNSLGVARAWGAVRKAADHGCNPTQVRNTAEHFRAHSKEHGWEPGALYERICELAPGQDPTDHWPPPSKAVARDLEERNQRARHYAQRQKTLEEKADLEADCIRIADLEAKFGGEIDSKSRGELREILRSNVPDRAVIYEKMFPARGSPGPGPLRTALLEILANS